MNRDKIIDRIETFKEWLVDIRRDFHMHPELGMEEFRTMSQICKYLDEMGLSYKSGIANTGVVVDIPGADPSFTVALRADIDGLPILDLKCENYSSKELGRCHACGHDVHTSILLGVAKFFSGETTPPYNVRLIFQPAEETTGGARPMIEAGVLKNVDVIFGLHVDDELNRGEIGIKYGAMIASSDTLKISIKGKSCHGAYPSNGTDAIVIASHVILALQTIVSRNIDARDSVVISLGTVNGGTQGNIVANQVNIVGTLRTLHPDMRKKALQRIEEIVTTLPIAFGGEGEFIREESYTSLINHDLQVDIVKRSGIEILGENKVIEKKKASMVAEDFAYFVEQIPGAFFYLGIQDRDRSTRVSLHNGNFDIEENALIDGVAMQVKNIYNAKG